MDEGIIIPSPSVFLRQSPPPAAPKPDVTAKPGKQHARRPSKEKKSTLKKASQSAVAADGSVVKPKQSKSRNGCVTCKAKRLKCGEEKPTCQQCARRNVECGGYKKDFKWRPFEETNVKLNIDRQKLATSPKAQASGDSSKSPTPLNDAQPKLPEAPQDSAETKSPAKDSPSDDGSDVYRTQRPTPPTSSPRMIDTPPQDSVHVSPLEEQPDPAPPPDVDVKHHASAHDFISSSASPSSQLALRLANPNQSRGNSPTLTEILHPLHDISGSSSHENFVNFSLPEDMHLPLLATGPGHVVMDDELLDIDPESAMDPDEIIDFAANIWPSGFGSPSFPNSPNSQQTLSLWHDQFHCMYQQPSLPPDSIESLTARFDRMTCGILSVMDGPSENPWRNLIWPLARQSAALHHAVAAMAAFHSSADNPAFRIKGGEHKQASIRFVREGIRDNSISDEIAIATALALGFSESWDHHTATGNTHIKGAQVLVKRALDRHRRNPLHGVELARLKFLCNAWVYMDVIARLTSVDNDESNDFDNTFLFTPDAPQMVMGNGAPGFGIDFGMPIDARLDPLMGCANTLFPLIGRVANLVRKVYRAQTNSPAVISQANDLKTCLENWEPPAFIERPEDPSTNVQHTLQTAEAYRWATLLHLHQSVPEIPSISSAELAQRVLQYLATVPLTSRTVIVHIYPLMVAGCEAVDPEDRLWVTQRWASMGQRMRIGVVDKCVAVTEEVWRRKDAYEAQPRSRGRVVATADLQPARQQRDSPFGGGGGGGGSGGGGSRRLQDFLPPSDPGRTGMVFSYVDFDGDGSLARMNIPEQRIGPMDVAYTVRGHCHWVGVMWDWRWEILLG